MKYGARNRIVGKVTSVRKGDEVLLVVKAIHVLPVKE